MNSEDTMLSEISQTQKNKYCMIYLCDKIPKVVKFTKTESRMNGGYQGLEGGGNGELVYNEQNIRLER